MKKIIEKVELLKQAMQENNERGSQRTEKNMNQAFDSLYQEITGKASDIVLPKFNSAIPVPVYMKI